MVNELTGWCGHQEAGSRPMESMTGGQVGFTKKLDQETSFFPSLLDLGDQTAGGK